MAKTISPVLGIALEEDRIYAVALQATPSKGPEVLAAVSTEMPPHVLDQRIIVRPDLVGNAIREMLAKAGIKVRDAVVGLPSPAVLSRVINIPTVSERERRDVVRGEIDYLNILPVGGDGFDFTLLSKHASASTATSPANTNSPKGNPVLFFASEPQILDSYFSAVTAAGLNVVRMEPSDYAAIRTTYPRLANRSIALAVSLGSTFTHLHFFEQGKSIYARRLDVGARHMLIPEASVMAHMAPDGASNPVQQASSSMAPHIHQERLDLANNARQRFAMEIGRSLDYVSREFVADLSGLYAVLLPNDVNLAGLPTYVSSALEHEIEFASTFQSVTLPSSVSAKLRTEERTAYAPALGLALAAVGGSFAGLPTFDLSSVALAESINRQLQHRFLVGAVAASVIAVAGIATGIGMEVRHAPVVQELTQKRQYLQQLDQQTQVIVTDMDNQKHLVDQIHAKNVPWTNLLNYLSMAVPPGIGLTSVTAQGSVLTITGSTLDANQVPVFWNTMNNSRLFISANVTSITRDKNKTNFQMNAVLPQPGPASNAPNGQGK